MAPQFNRNSSLFARIRLCTFAFIAAGLLAWPGPAGAQQPQMTPAEMEQNGRRNIELKLAELLPTVKDARTAFNAIREFTDTRRLAQRVVAMDYPLDDFAGILIVDSYDEKYVAAIDSLGLRFESLDRTPPDAAAFQMFKNRLGELPPLGDTPAGFVVAYVIGRCTAAASSLPDSLDPAMREGVTEVAVRLIDEVAHNYMATRVGEARQKSDEFWHVSVIKRMRCKQHDSDYAVQEERNGLKADGSLYRRYIVKCETGGEMRKLDFDLGEMGTMSQNGGRQNLKKTAEDPGRRKPGVEP